MVFKKKVSTSFWDGVQFSALESGNSHVDPDVAYVWKTRSLKFYGREHKETRLAWIII